jgi:hypothetical protein
MSLKIQFIIKIRDSKNSKTKSIHLEKALKKEKKTLDNTKDKSNCLNNKFRIWKDKETDF